MSDESVKAAIKCNTYLLTVNVVVIGITVYLAVTVSNHWYIVAYAIAGAYNTWNAYRSIRSIRAGRRILSSPLRYLAYVQNEFGAK